MSQLEPQCIVQRHNGHSVIDGVDFRLETACLVSLPVQSDSGKTRQQ